MERVTLRTRQSTDQANFILLEYKRNLDGDPFEYSDEMIRQFLNVCIDFNKTSTAVALSERRWRSITTWIPRFNDSNW